MTVLSLLMDFAMTLFLSLLCLSFSSQDWHRQHDLLAVTGMVHNLALQSIKKTSMLARLQKQQKKRRITLFGSEAGGSQLPRPVFKDLDPEREVRKRAISWIPTQMLCLALAADISHLALHLCKCSIRWREASVVTENAALAFVHSFHHVS